MDTDLNIRHRDASHARTRELSPSSTARQLSSTALDSSSTARQPRPQLSSCQVDSFSTASRQLLDSSTVMQRSGAVKAVKLSTRQLDSLDSSTARQLRLGLPCMNWWLHLVWIALFEVHPSRKVSLDKCSHQGSAHWQQYALHSAPSNRGSHPRGGVPWALRSDGVPPTHWVAHQG